MKQFRTMLLGSAAMRACAAAILTVLYIGGYALGAKTPSTPPNDCYDRAKIIEGLEGGFAEKLTSMGLARMPARRDEAGMTARLGREDAPGALGRCQNLNQNTVWIDVPVKALGFGM